MKLIDNAREVWKHWSTWALSTVVGIGGAWVSIPDEIKTNLPHYVSEGVSWVVTIAALLGLGAKFSPQKNLTPPDQPENKP